MNTVTLDNSNNWVRETRIGTWFLTTWMWRRHVLPGTMADLATLVGEKREVGRLLDIGCGQGFAFPLLDRLFRPSHLLGIDIDPSLVKQGETVAVRCTCNAEIRVGDATSLALPDASIDTVFCHQSFHHLSQQEEAAREFYRVLVPGGRLLFTESCRSFIYAWWIRLFFRHPMEVQKTAEEYVALLRATGFEIDDNDVTTPYPPWSRADFGLLAALGHPPVKPHRVPLVCLVAHRPE